jgi:hypothetical protein
LPLFADGARKIRQNLQRASRGERPGLVGIGYLTEEQLTLLNLERARIGFPALKGQVIFRGTHVYESRCVRDGYTVEEVIFQIQEAFSLEATVHYTGGPTSLRSVKTRQGQGGTLIRDEVVFECTSKYPKAELFSVIPRGDGKKSPQRKNPSMRGSP